MISFVCRLVCFFVVVKICIDSSALADSSNETGSLQISPQDLLVATGDTLQLQCTLSGFPAEVTWQSLYFEPADSSYVTSRVDDRTILLRRPNMTREHSMGHIVCNVRNYPSVFAQASVRVADRPMKPEIKECIVDNWEQMTCRWEPPEQDTGIVTIQWLAWRIAGSGSSFSYCPHYGPKNSSCTWLPYDHKDTFRANMNYSLRVNASNALGSTVSAWAHIVTAHQVKPARIENPNVKSLSSRSLFVEWQESHSEKLVSFQFTYSPEWDDTAIKILVTADRNVTLVDLEPYTVYTMSVKCIPLVMIDGVLERRGYWSDDYSFQYRTLSDVPGQAPAIVPGSYRATLDDSAKGQHIEVFWQKIPVRYRHGIIEKYLITYQNISGGVGQSEQYQEVMNNNNNKISELISVVLPVDSNYLITVSAQTDRGFNISLPSNSVIIPSFEARPSHPQRFVVSTDESSNNVYFTWSSVEDAVGYTVYWCNTTVQHQVMYRTGSDKCENEVHWQSVAINLTSFVGVVDEKRIHNHGMLYGLSVERLHVIGSRNVTVSSGIAWNDCTYNMKNSVIEPQNVHFAAHQQANNLTVEWQRPGCLFTNFISHYIVAYCNGVVSDCHQPEDWKEAVVNGAATTSITLTNLNPDESYYVKVKSASYLGESAFTKPIEQQVLRDGLTRGAIVGIAIGSVLGVFVVVFGLVTIVRVCKKYVKKFVHVEIAVPHYEVHHINEEMAVYTRYDNLSEQEPMLMTFTPPSSGQPTLCVDGGNAALQLISENEPVDTTPPCPKMTMSDFVISPYTLTYLEDGSTLPDLPINGTIHHHVSQPPNNLHTPADHQSANTSPAEHRRLSESEDPTAMEHVAEQQLVAAEPSNFADSPYVQIPASSSSQSAESPPADISASSRISPYTVVE